MSETTAPETVLADWRGSAAVLRSRGHAHDAQILDQCADEMQAALGAYIVWISEPDAMLKSGRGVDYFRSRFPDWNAAGMAELRNGRRRWYRSLVVPQRTHASVARLAGLRGDAV